MPLLIFQHCFTLHQPGYDCPEFRVQRLYLETMAKVLPLIPEKWIIEQGGADGGILLKLDLDAQKQ